jgi:tetratricopeptide (TPR) repeat protein
MWVGLTVIGGGLDRTSWGGNPEPKAEPKPPAASGERSEPDERDRGPSPARQDDFGFPDPDRPWGRPRYLDPDRLHRRGLWRTYVTRPRYYYDDFTYRFGVPYYDDYRNDDFERAYRQGVEDGRNFERFEIQAERGFANYTQAMAEGYAAFEKGDFGVAARAFLLAARLNQGDPACRLCAAHAQVALGRYEAAVHLLQRAFDLQPKIAYLPLDVRTAYGVDSDFDHHLAALRAAADRESENADLQWLLGYYYFFSGRAAKAEPLFRRALDLRPDDRLFRHFADVTGLITPKSHSGRD